MSVKMILIHKIIAIKTKNCDIISNSLVTPGALKKEAPNFSRRVWLHLCTHV